MSFEHRLAINLNGCKYEVLRAVAKKLDLAVITDEKDGSDWDVYWSDLSVSVERVSKLKVFQRVNHFPGMLEICRKHSLSRHLQRVSQQFPQEYQFYSPTFALPHQLNDFIKNLRDARRQAREICKEAPTWIIKPSAGAMGRGIALVQTEKQFHEGELDVLAVAQLYINSPALIDGFKFDMRIYVLVTSVEPLQVLMYDEGLARFATQPYVSPNHSNLAFHTMHLTNYAINKNNVSFVSGVEAAPSKASKRLLSSVLEELQSTYQWSCKKIWDDVAKIVAKTILCIQPLLAHSYHQARPGAFEKSDSQCFELLGFDIILDNTGKAWLLEVNHSPSLATDSSMDLALKSGLLADTLVALNLNSSKRVAYYEQQHAARAGRLYESSSQNKLTKHQCTFNKEQDIKDATRHLQLVAKAWESDAGSDSSNATSTHSSKSLMGLGKYHQVFPPPNAETRKAWQDVMDFAAKVQLDPRCTCGYCTQRKRLAQFTEAVKNLNKHAVESTQTGAKWGFSSITGLPSRSLQRRPSSASSCITRVAADQAKTPARQSAVVPYRPPAPLALHLKLMYPNPIMQSFDNLSPRFRRSAFSLSDQSFNSPRQRRISTESLKSDDVGISTSKSGRRDTFGGATSIRSIVDARDATPEFFKPRPPIPRPSSASIRPRIRSPSKGKPLLHPSAACGLGVTRPQSAGYRRADVT